MTFDDGYADTLSIALPICRRLRVPLAVYPVTSLIARTAIVWWYAIEVLLIRSSSVQVTFPGEIDSTIYSCATFRDKLRTFGELRQQIVTGLASRDPALVTEWLSSWLRTEGVDLAACASLIMTNDQLRELALDPLVTIGTHTSNHRRLDLLTGPVVDAELSDSARLLSQMIDASIVHGACPYGVLPRDVASLVGLDSLCCGVSAAALPHPIVRPVVLPRIQVPGGMSVTATLSRLRPVGV